MLIGSPPHLDWTLRAEAGGTFPFFALPDNPAYGFFAAFGWQPLPSFEVDFSFIGLLPSSVEVGEARLTAYSFLGRVNLCGRLGDFALCGLVTSGATLGGGKGFATD